MELIDLSGSKYVDQEKNTQSTHGEIRRQASLLEVDLKERVCKGDIERIISDCLASVLHPKVCCKWFKCQWCWSESRQSHMDREPGRKARASQSFLQGR